MKTKYVGDLNTEQALTSIFLVCAKEVRSTREGRPYLRMELGDRTGTIEARMWTGFEHAASQVSRDDFVQVKGRVEIYKNKPQLSLESFRRAAPEEVDLADYLAHTAANVDQLYAELLETVAAIRNPWLQKLVTKILSEPGIASRYKKAPAAKVMHHAYLGGLLEHVMSVCGLAKLAAAHYPELNLDILLTGVILHDVSKLDELCYERAIGYTTEGQLLGHIVMEVELVGRAMDGIEGFPAALRTVVQHLIISHHGEYEFGSPKLPMIREALVLHYLDDLDSKMAAARAVLAVNSGDAQWSDWSSALQRKFLRLEEYLKPQEAAPEKGGAAKAGPAPGLFK
ncbi:MAG: HD domain-containing protein [Acidobacteriia bacterium]|nr:HD domain-containing protein [Terriglobia bacterium]